MRRISGSVLTSCLNFRSVVRLAAKAFIQLGLKPHHAVNILGFNAPEWSIRQALQAIL